VILAFADRLRRGKPARLPRRSLLTEAGLRRFRLGADKSPAPSAQALQPSRSDASLPGREPDPRHGSPFWGQDRRRPVRTGLTGRRNCHRIRKSAPGGLAPPERKFRQRRNQQNRSLPSGFAREDAISGLPRALLRFSSAFLRPNFGSGGTSPPGAACSLAARAKESYYLLRVRMYNSTNISHRTKFSRRTI